MTQLTQPLYILGIAENEDVSKTNDCADVIRRGLSIASFKRVADYYQLSNAQMSEKIGTSLRTIIRLEKEKKPLNPTWSDRLYRLARIAAQAQTVFENPKTATDWLKRPNRALDGYAPVDLLDTDAGTQQVAELLDRIEYGVYS
jgi:putative toxin-antitoxin system antitoxin component (TIGR02293 family)